MKKIKLSITESGGIEMLHDDAVSLKDFGEVKVIRASHIEFNNTLQKWYVQSALTLIILKDDFETREQALDWEREYFSPNGEGWLEIK